MAGISIRMAKDDSDLATARALCRAWLDWHWNAYPADWPIEGDHPMDRERFEATLDDLPRLHARPRGGILLAFLEGRPVGCVMYNAAAPDIAEFNRLFVSEAGRGHGIGRAMLERMFEAMIADGYRTVRFSSARFLVHARAMYEAAGFADIPHPDGFPERWRAYVYFMERPLFRT